MLSLLVHLYQVYTDWVFILSEDFYLRREINVDMSGITSPIIAAHLFEIHNTHFKPIALLTPSIKSNHHAQRKAAAINLQVSWLMTAVESHGGNYPLIYDVNTPLL